MSSQSEWIAQYRIMRALGQGSFGDVFEVLREHAGELEKRVVLKRLSPERARDPRFVDIFTAGAELASRLGHANILQVLDVGRDDARDGTPFVVSELASGMNLSGLLAELERSSVAAPTGLALYVGSEIAKALDHAHRRTDYDGRRYAIVHGDLCPTNVFVTWEGEVKLSDFCIGDALFQVDPDSAALIGKWSYASPELACGERPSPATDLFSVGVLLFELLSGQNPFDRPKTVQIRRALALLESAPSLAEVCPALPDELLAIVTGLLAPHPAARTPSAARLHDALMEYGYTSGSRFSATDLAELLSTLRPKPSVAPAPALRGLLGSIHESSAPELEVRYEALDARETLPPVWPRDGSTEDATVLVIGFDADAPEATIAFVTSTLERFTARLHIRDPREIAAIFGLGSSDGRDAENAARAARLLLGTLQHSGLGVSAGICGARLRVSRDGGAEDDGVLGDSLARARALSGKRGWAVADRRTARELRRSFELEPLGSDGNAWVIEEPRAEPHGEFVGRRQLLENIAELLERAHTGRLHVLGLVGEAGIGKTRTLNELVRRLRRGGANVGFARAVCPPGGRHEPLSGADAMLRALLGVREADLAGRMQAVEKQLRALGLNEVQARSALSRVGGAAERPIPGDAALSPVLTQIFSSLARDRMHLLAWDDAHEIDGATVELLQSAIGPLGGTRVVIAFAARPNASAEYRKLSGYTEFPIGELDERESRGLIRLRLGVDRVSERIFSFFHERAGGHPMFLEELVHEALEEGALRVAHGFVEEAKLETHAVPRTLRAALANRLRRLPQVERELLVAAAVLAEPVELPVLAHMTDLTLAAVDALLDALAQRDVVRRAPDARTSLASPLLCEVCVSELEPATLAHLHRRAADAYQAVFDDQSEVAHRIALHLERAGDRRAAADYFHRSGMQHLRSGRLDHAVQELSRSIVLDKTTIESGELLLRVSALAQATAKTPERRGVLEAVGVALELLATLEPLDARSRASALLDLGKILAQTDREGEARGVLDDVVAQSGPWPELCRAALTSAAEIALRGGDFAEALALAQRAIELGPGSVRERHRLLLTRAQALASTERHDEALEALELAAALDPDTDPTLAGERARTRAIIYAFAGDWQASADASEEAAEHGRSVGLSREVAANLHNQGEALIRLGELARGYAALHASLALAEEAGSDRIANFDRLFLAYLDAIDELPGADEMLSRCMALAADRGWTLDHLTARFLLGKLLASRGELEAARRELSSVRTRALELENRPLARDCSYELELCEPTISESS